MAIADTLNLLRNKGIVFSAGQGIISESIVIYCLGITDVDPIQFDLVFERLCNANSLVDALKKSDVILKLFCGEN